MKSVYIYIYIYIYIVLIGMAEGERPLRGSKQKEEDNVKLDLRRMCY
jgi:hypothetical protein